MGTNYIYKSDNFCVKCGEQIKQELYWEYEDVPENHYDSDDYPMMILTREFDSPQHCMGCEIPLENSLTEDGINYVMERIANKISKVFSGEITGFSTRHDCRHEGCWYSGNRHIEITRDWAKQVRDYTHLLSVPQLKCVNFFLELTED